MSFKKNIIAFIVISLLGTIGHFIFNWTGQNEIIGLFFPVNESVWEHLKLVFLPFLIYSIIEYFFSKEKPDNYFPAVAIGILNAIFIIIAIYYIANGIIGYDVEFINIGSYYVGVLIGLCKRNKILSSKKFTSKGANIFFIASLIILGVLFAVFTNNPPSLGIFTPPMPV